MGKFFSDLSFNCGGPETGQNRLQVAGHGGGSLGGFFTPWPCGRRITLHRVLDCYTSLSEADLIFRHRAKTMFGSQRFEHLYRSWKGVRASKSDIRLEFKGSNRFYATVHFATELLFQLASSKRKLEGKG